MKIFLFLILAIPCFAQDLYIKVSDIQTIRIQKGSVYYDTLPKGVGIVYRQLWTDHGLVDTTKQIIVKYETLIIDAVQPPTVGVDTVDSESLTYSGWARHGATSTPGWHKGTISYSSTGEARYTFTGTEVEIWGETGPNHGTGSVNVNGETRVINWASASVKLPAKLVEFEGLPNKQHTVTIRPVSGVILLDFLVIHK